MDLHPQIPLVALLGLVHLRIPLPAFVLGGAGAELKVASTIVPCRIVMPFELRWALTV